MSSPERDRGVAAEERRRPASPSASPGRGVGSGETTAEEARWARFVRDFVDGVFQRNPDVAVEAGRHEFDGRLPEWSDEALREQTAWLRGIRRDGEAFDAGRLPESARFEREYLLAEVDRRLYWLEDAAWPYRNPAFYADSLDPHVYVTRAYAPPVERLRAYTAYAREVPRAARQIRANLESPLPRTYARHGRESFAGLAAFFEEEAWEAFHEVGEPRLREDFAAANREAGLALRELARWFAEEEERADGAPALGASAFARMLRATERVEISPEALERIGEEELERNREELREACSRFRPGGDFRECIAAARGRKPPGGVLEGARKELGRLERFVVERELVTVPEHAGVTVEASPPYLRWNSAYIRIPGPYDRHLPAAFYLTPPDPSWTPEEREGYVPGRADLLFASVHEVWPGHFLQFLHSNRAPSLLGRVFVGYGYAEGWAHYAEEMAWEAGLGEGDPEAHLGKVMNALVRTARFLVAVRLHAGAIDVAEAERLFREEALLDAAGARQQAARGTFDPAYLNYTLGRLMIQKLRGEWLSAAGDQGSWRAFHDRFLSFGGPPIPLVRRALLGAGAGAPL